MGTRLSVGGEQRFAVLMIALSVAIFLAIWRSERNATWFRCPLWAATLQIAGQYRITSPMLY